VIRLGQPDIRTTLDPKKVRVSSGKCKLTLPREETGQPLGDS